MTLIDLRGQRERADAAYAAELAAWMAAGEQEPKPVSEEKALDEAIADAEAEHAANAPLSPRTHSPLESPCSSSRR